MDASIPEGDHNACNDTRVWSYTGEQLNAALFTFGRKIQREVLVAVLAFAESWKEQLMIGAEGGIRLKCRCTWNNNLNHFGLEKC